ncbi:MAG: outer membrane protein transport protein [Pseudomonadota bacterium]
MKRTPGLYRAAVFVSGMVCTSIATATTGYFALGYGAKAMGMAGAVVSNPQDSIAAATNPAGMALVGERVDVGIRFFSPIREAEITTSAVGAGSNFGTPFDVADQSRRNMHYIPNAGYTSRINDRLYWGISVYGNGGMNTTYDRNLYDQTAAVLFNPSGPGATPAGVGTGAPQTGKLGVDLAQVLFTPTIAMKLNDRHAVGATLIIGSQRFSARGLGNFQCLTTDVQANPAGCATGYPVTPSDGLTDNSSDITYGAGVRLGWIGEITSTVTLGATVASKVYMKEFGDYDNLFAEQGDFDVPANFAVGATFKATPKLKLSLDFQRILYEGVKSLSNPGPVASAFGPVPNPPTTGFLGADNGLGFGWEDINVYRIGMEYAYDSNWTLRAGLAVNDQPIPKDEVLFNILAPAVIEKHLTLGFTYQPDGSSEWNFAYMHGFEESITDDATAFGVPATIKMYQNSVDISYSRKF